ncbi:hypothetical protein KHA94_06310 [Bacillus sp. FJAT-49705]|uniref:Uncharacterized protein n=1 Tax=Cytobacillus citreus TaxID=2833586 RepID=A0ABS5NPR2_9BACI|nr:hypothetical protein [Cytobacillus citreus]MBS4189819.1 hypothetical protein [Cytobacillus citreus]
MKKRTLLIYVILLILVSSGGLLLKSNFLQSSQTSNNLEKEIKNQVYYVKSFNSLPDREITFLEAYQFGFKKAKELDKTAELMFLNSVDDGKVSGQDGKKANWQGVFALPYINRQIVFVIEKGKLKSYEIIDKSDELTIKDKNIKIDSPQIVKAAIKYFNLQPSPRDHPFSHGYHFRILRDEKNIFFAVDGQVDGKAVEIYYHPKTGEYMGRTEAKK